MISLRGRKSQIKQAAKARFKKVIFSSVKRKEWGKERLASATFATLGPTEPFIHQRPGHKDLQRLCKDATVLKDEQHETVSKTDTVLSCSGAGLQGPETEGQHWTETT